MRRTTAMVTYWLGLTFGLGAVVQSAVHAQWWELPVVPLLPMAIWWIAAGIGLRLGVAPSEFFRATARAIGLLDPTDEGSEARTRTG